VALAQHLGAILVTLDGEQRQRAPEAVVARTPAAALAAFTQGASSQEEDE